MAAGYGPWDPLDVDDVTELLNDLLDGVRWWFTGGHALELHLERSWRAHDDIDVSIRRIDTEYLARLRNDWEIHVAVAGRLRPWDGGPLSAADHENNLWVRRPAGPWALDITIGEGTDDQWVYRRDPRLVLPWSEAVLADAAGRRYLAPALQLLFKAKQPRPKDDLDAQVVVPELDSWSLALLDARLEAHHRWLDLVGAHRRGMRDTDVIDVLEMLSAAGVVAWVDGGWGIDALLGAQQRPHVDLDLALASRHWQASVDALERRGFRLVRDDGPFNQVFLDRVGRLVDLHAFDDETTTIGSDGVEVHGPNGLAYRTGGFGGTGTVAGSPVRCMTAEFQMWSHTGYDVDIGDFRDVERLHERFGLPIPRDYAPWLED